MGAALRIIIEKGPDKLSLREVARRVDYSPAGLYEYFDGKDALIEAVCAEGDRRLHAFLSSVGDDLPLDKYLVELGLAYLQFAFQNKEHFMLMFTTLVSDDPIPVEALEGDGAYSILVAAVQRGINEGLIKTEDNFGIHDISYSLWSLVHGMAILRLTNLSGLEYDFAPAERKVIATLVRGLLIKT